MNACNFSASSALSLLAIGVDGVTGVIQFHSLPQNSPMRAIAVLIMVQMLLLMEYLLNVCAFKRIFLY